MAFIRSPEIALAIVRAEQRRHGVWSDLTAEQARNIRAVIMDDQRGRLTRDALVARLHGIANQPTPAGRPVAQGGICPACGRYVVLLIDGRLLAHTVPGVFDRPCHQGGA